MLPPDAVAFTERGLLFFCSFPSPMTMRTQRETFVSACSP
jgi:hypothetical protein